MSTRLLLFFTKYYLKLVLVYYYSNKPNLIWCNLNNFLRDTIPQTSRVWTLFLQWTSGVPPTLGPLAQHLCGDLRHGTHCAPNRLYPTSQVKMPTLMWYVFLTSVFPTIL